MLDTWICTTGDDLFALMEEGRLLPSRPLAFGPPVFLYEHRGALIEVTATVAPNGLSAWQFTRRAAS